MCAGISRIDGPLRLQLRRRKLPVSHRKREDRNRPSASRTAKRPKGETGRSPERTRGDGGKWIAERGAVGRYGGVCGAEGEAGVGCGSDWTGNESLEVVYGAHLMGGSCGK